ncbi:ABC-three component system middle component 1 [Streptococcus hyointestinalis]|uniref:ABC-three component system middle component 1 n=1 Tax=Streptococcus hyointestinalis TaxID=1337 RepID=UPI0023F92141|nr:ABC-three component system middle component 1 [Streptococcus hyointestinalis]
MNNFIKGILEKYDYHQYSDNIKLWNNSNEFFLIQEYDVEELESSSEVMLNFFTCKKTEQLISEFEKIQDNKMKKNTSLFITVKVENLEKEYERLKNIAMRIEEDEYYFRKYVIFYTEEGLNKLKPNVEYLLDYINSESPDEKSLFDKFEENMFFDDAYFVAMQLIVKLPFISLPHSDTHFETIEDRIKSRIEFKKLVNQEEQVNQILELLNGDNISEQLKNSAILGRLGEILET